MKLNNIYFAADEGGKTASFLQQKVDEWCNTLEYNGYLEKLKTQYACYHGAYFADTGNGHQITFGGEQGELVNLPINHFRNIATHILNMTTANRPTMECRAANTDYRSQVQTILANNILEYYTREKKLEQFIKKAVEYAIVYGAGYIRMEWDAGRGEVVDYIEETQTEIREGDLTFTNLSVFDVIYDGTKENESDLDWVLIRTWKNKYDLAAKYPEFADKILGLETKDQINNYRMGLTNLTDQTDDVEIIEFYHKRTDALPNGRYMMFCAEDIVLQDIPMPYRVLPVFRIVPGEIHGTPYGYTPMFDLVPIQDALNSLYSTVLTNQNAFGVQNILNPRGADIAVNSLAGGLNIIDYNAIGGAKPESLQLTDTPEEVFKFIGMLEQTMETLSGVNSVARGNPEASLKSGTALALVQSMALQFMSGLQGNYVNFVEQIGSAIIKMLQDFAHTPRIIAIVGKSKAAEIAQFTSDDISNISRVSVSIGNPMAQTTAGRVQMAQELIQYSTITPKQYVNLLNTGNLDGLIENIEHENLLMKAENEALMNGEEPLVTPIDQHKEHIEFHKAVLADPELRKDASLVKRALDHIQQHINALREVDPDLLMLLGQQPLPPMPMPGSPTDPNSPMPGGEGGAPMPPEDPQGLSAGAMMPPQQGQVGLGVIGGELAGPGIEGGQRIPNIPKVPSDLLANPALQQQALQNTK
jgi:hypothetical protein